MDKAKRTLIAKGIIVAAICAAVFALWPSVSNRHTSPRDFDEICKEGVLRAATEYSTVVTGPMRDSLLLSTPIVLNKLVLVQRKPASDDDSTYVKSQMELGGRTIHIVKGSPEALRLRNLEYEIGDTIYIEEIEKYGPEQLIYMVSHGDIDYTVCDATIAHNEAHEIKNIDTKTDVGFTQFYSWAADKNSPALMDSLNVFLKSYCKTAEYKELYNKYYK
jgi:hypothetical protein